MNTATIVQKPCNYCNVLRNDGGASTGSARTGLEAALEQSREILADVR